jgi:hypothetical protein
MRCPIASFRRHWVYAVQILRFSQYSFREAIPYFGQVWNLGKISFYMSDLSLIPNQTYHSKNYPFTLSPELNRRVEVCNCGLKFSRITLRWTQGDRFSAWLTGDSYHFALFHFTLNWDYHNSLVLRLEPVLISSNDQCMNTFSTRTFENSVLRLS